MRIDIDFHPAALKAMDDLRLSITDGAQPPAVPTPKYATVEDMIEDHVWFSLTKPALERHPPADLDAAIKAKQAELNALVDGEFEKKRRRNKAA